MPAVQWVSSIFAFPIITFPSLNVENSTIFIITHNLLFWCSLEKNHYWWWSGRRGGKNYYGHIFNKNLIWQRYNFNTTYTTEVWSRTKIESLKSKSVWMVEDLAPTFTLCTRERGRNKLFWNNRKVYNIKLSAYRHQPERGEKGGESEDWVRRCMAM